MELIGILLPLGIDLVNRKIKDSDVRFWVSVAICAVVGILINWLQTSFAFANPMAAFDSVSKSILAVFGLAQISYKAVWENAPIREGLDMKAKDDNNV